MKFFLLLFLLVVSSLADDDYNFNDKDDCKFGGRQVTLSTGKSAKVKFRQPSDSFGAAWNNLLNLVPDECSITFSGKFLSNTRFRVRFDSKDRHINDSQAKIILYDANEVKVAKKMREISKQLPVKKDEVIETTGGYLVIQVSRDYKNAKDYNVEMIVEAFNSAYKAVLSWTMVFSALLFTAMTRFL